MSGTEGEGRGDKSIGVRVNVDGLFSWLGDVHSVGMASRAVVCFVEVNFVGRVLIQKLGDGTVHGAAQSRKKEQTRTQVAARPVTPEPTTATRIVSNHR
jgi:hypothetical protein